MTDLDRISEKLSDQLEEYEKSALNTTDRLKEVEEYINSRLRRARKILLLLKQSSNWMAKLSRVIDILEEIQCIMDRIEDVEAATEPADEILMDVESFSNEFAISDMS